ncbi:MAG: cytochrome b5 domain-containing protein [Candidatus Limiplasma sp.]|nr:cytochrome b5 domain-containing protein [Candidatus Limiplasma sp.]
MKKHRIFLIAVAILLLLMSPGCTPQPPTNVASGSPQPSAASDSSQNPQLELTLEELAAYDGKDGNPAYIAVDGVIYDVSGSSRWKNGEHNGYSAGQDLTDKIKSVSPHGLSVLTRMPVMGKIVE